MFDLFKFHLKFELFRTKSWENVTIKFNLCQNLKLRLVAKRITKSELLKLKNLKNGKVTFFII